MSKSLTLLALILVAAGAAVFFWNRGDDGVAPAVPETTTPASDGAESRPAIEPATAVVEFIDQELSEEEKLRTIKLPNGKRVPTLNDVVFLREIPANISRTPIVAIETEPSGRQYYLHEDGSHTKPIWITNQLTGEKLGTIVVERPRPFDPADVKELPEGTRGLLPNQPPRRR